MNLKNELIRKAIHQSALVIPVTYLFTSKSFVLKLLIPFTVLVITCDAARIYNNRLKRLFYKIFGNVVRLHEHGHLSGTTYFLSATSIVIFVFPKHYVVFSLFVLIVSDTAAALIGKKYGRHRIFNKTLEGSAAFFVSALFIGLIYNEIPVIQAFAGAAAGTIIEALPVSMDDNFSIPLGMCTLLYLLFMIR